MNVSAIQVAQAAQPQGALAQSSQKAAGGAAKTSAVNTTESAAATVKTPSTTAVENNALQEQGRGQNTENGAGGATGTRVNLFA